MSREPYKKKWGKSGIPTEREINEGQSGFISFGLLEELKDILRQTELFGLTVGPRTIGANTVPRCYVFVDELSFDLGYDYIACIDVTRETCRLLIRPFGRGTNRVLFLQDELKHHFCKSDPMDWLQFYIDSDQDRAIAIDVLNHIRIEYQKVYTIPNR